MINYGTTINGYDEQFNSMLLVLINYQLPVYELKFKTVSICFIRSYREQNNRECAY